jgi:hypothetical protein
LKPYHDHNDGDHNGKYRRHKRPRLINGKGDSRVVLQAKPNSSAYMNTMRGERVSSPGLRNGIEGGDHECHHHHGGIYAKG